MVLKFGWVGVGFFEFCCWVLLYRSHTSYALVAKVRFQRGRARVKDAVRFCIFESGKMDG